MYVYTYIDIRIFIRIHIYIHMYRYLYIWIYIFIHAYLFRYIHECRWSNSPLFAHVRMGHVTHGNESRRTWESDRSHLRMSHEFSTISSKLKTPQNFWKSLPLCMRTRNFWYDYQTITIQLLHNNCTFTIGLTFENFYLCACPREFRVVGSCWEIEPSWLLRVCRVSESFMFPSV